MINYKPINPHGLSIGICKDWNSEWYKNEDISQEIDINLESVKNNPKSPINKIGKVKDWDEER